MRTSRSVSFVVVFVLLLMLSMLLSVLAQETTPELLLTIGTQSCALALLADDSEQMAVTPEATAESGANPPVLTLGDDCVVVATRLVVAANGTLWLSLTRADALGEWLGLDAVEGDDHPPQLDARGRYFGCANPVQGEQVCRVQVEVDEMVYQVEIPMLVGGVYNTPTAAATAPPPPTAAATGQPPQGTGDGNSPPAPTAAINPTVSPPPPVLTVEVSG